MNEHLNEAICVVVTSIIAGIIRFFEKKKMAKNKEDQSTDHFRKL